MKDDDWRDVRLAPPTVDDEGPAEFVFEGRIVECRVDNNWGNLEIIDSHGQPVLHTEAKRWRRVFPWRKANPAKPCRHRHE